MKILVIASSTGNTAPGKVFSKYLSLMEKDKCVDIDVISNDSSVNATYMKLKKIHPRIKKISVSYFGCDIFDYFQAKEYMKKMEKRYDIVFSMMSANHFFPLYFGYFYKKKFKDVQWINYSVDAIPAPEGWGLSKSYSDGLIRMIKKFLINVDHLYFSNQVMLSYQLELLGNCFNGKSGVLYTLPHHDYIELLPKQNKRPFTLLYTGGIYQARRVDQLLLALEKLVLEGIDIQLNFVGTNPAAVDLSIISEKASSKIKFFGYATDLLPFYQEADLLIDIDAAIENDVFISSKFFNYLMINRNILCITSQDSPTMQLVKEKNLSGIFFSTHYSDEIANKLSSVIGNSIAINHRKNEFSFEENTLKILDIERLNESI